jgi:long-chain acyl-CoA synthetase
MADLGALTVRRVDQGTDGVLLTGATGFIGMQVLARYLEGTTRPVFVLVRGRDNRDATARLEHTLARLYGPDHPFGGRVTAVRGDITRPDLGLGRRRDGLAERVREIVHGAASVSFSLGLDPSRTINVEGTRAVLDFATRCQAAGGLRRLSYVSTAYVAGEHRGCFSEDDLQVGQRFRNPYERSKFEAESLIAGVRERLPVTVMRPSIVVGERSTGFTTAFNVLYWPLRALARGTYAALPARADAPVDVVPVDYVADAIFALAHAPEAEGVTFHLTAGTHTSTVGEIAEMASRFFGRPSPRLIEPWIYERVVHPVLTRSISDPRVLRTLKASEVFFPYFTAKCSFDNRRARMALRGTGIQCTPLHTYFDRLIEYALAADWGRRDPWPEGTVAMRVPAPLRHTTGGAIDSALLEESDPDLLVAL